MNPYELHRRALAAVAKLTVFASTATVAGCTGQVIIESDESYEDVEPGKADPSDPPDVAVDPMEPEYACFEEKVDTDACCNAMLQKSFSDDHLYVDPKLATDDEKACCELALDTMDAWDWTGDQPVPPEAQQGCCYSGIIEAGWENHPTCTPWGPPMPPAMPLHFFERWNEVIA